MEVSLFVAKVMGPIYLIVGVGMLLNREFYQRVMEDYPKNSALVFFSGVFPLVLGVVILLLHNTWAANWTVLITIIGWGGLIKGIWLTVFPKTVQGFMKAYLKNKALLAIHSLIALVFGAFLTVMGYGILK